MTPRNDNDLLGQINKLIVFRFGSGNLATCTGHNTPRVVCSTLAGLC